MQEISFFILSILVILSAIGVVIAKDLVYAVLSLALFLLSIAGLYILLDAEFLAMLQIFIYIGAIVVMFLFVIMLTHKIRDKLVDRTTLQKYPAIFLCGILWIILYIILTKTIWPVGVGETAAEVSTIKEIGKTFLTTYAIAFEALSILLLLALIGAIIFLRKEE